jgi:hypothetical protein
MARPPQFDRPDDPTRDVTAVKVAIKHLTPNDRAQLIAWMLLYYRDDGAMFSPQISRRRVLAFARPEASAKWLTLEE